MSLSLKDASEIVPHKELTVQKMRELHKAKSCWAIAPEPIVFKQGILVDGFSMGRIMSIIEAISEENRGKWDTIISQDPYKLANFLDKMWTMGKA